MPSSLTTAGMERVAIFGATSAVAQEVAASFAASGARLVLVGRNEQKLAALVNRLPPRSVVDSVVADLEDVGAAAALVERVTQALGGLDAALVAHGLLPDQLDTEVKFEVASQAWQVNFTSVVALLIPLANRFEGQGYGVICALSSVAGVRGRPRNYTYGAAKSALTTYLEGLRSRLWPRVRVVAVQLGPVDTPMTTDHPKNFSFVDSQTAAKGIVKAMRQSSGVVYVPAFWRPVMAVVRLLPEALFQRLRFLSAR